MGIFCEDIYKLLKQKDLMDFLFIANGRYENKDAYHSLDLIKLNNYSIPCFEAAEKLGFSLYMGVNKLYAEQLSSNKYGVNFYDAQIYRKPFKVREMCEAYKRLSTFLKSHHVALLHCNTPIGGLLGRLCGKKYHVPKVIYTAHGFHFYKDAPLLNKVLYKTVETWLAKMTDVIITINQEDYEAALRMNLKKGGKVYKVHGVGINTDINKVSADELELNRKELNLVGEDIVLIAVGDLNANKNFATIINAMASTPKNCKLLICGLGPDEKKLRDIAKKKDVEERVFFLGYRRDMNVLYQIADIAVIPSFREGLPRVTMEAMTYSLPCVVSDIRGNRDLIDDSGGMLIKPTNFIGFGEAISLLSKDCRLRQSMGERNVQFIKAYDIENVKKEIFEIYKTIT